MILQRRQRTGLAGLAITAAALAAALVDGSRTVAADTTTAPPPLISPRSCPRQPQNLPADAVAAAARAALRSERRRDQPRILSAGLADHGGPRGQMVRANCGRRVWRRTVAVGIDLRRYHPSASLSERVSFVARTTNGYIVYALGH
jgi:hypothetical protein